MKAAAVADLQFHGQNVDHCVTILERVIVEDMIPRGVEWIFCAGDWSEYGRVGDRHKPASYIVRKFADMVTRTAVPWIIIAGNHDLDRNGYCGLDLLKDHPLIIVTPRPQSYNLGEVGVVCLPWFESDTPWLPSGVNIKQKCRRLLEDLTGDVRHLRFEGCKHVVFLAHIEVEGACMPNGSLLRASRYAFSHNELKSVNADSVICGHVHLPEWPYIGPPWQKDFGEENLRTGWTFISPPLDNEHVMIGDTLRHVTITEEEVNSGTVTVTFPLPPTLKIRYVGNEIPQQFLDAGIKPIRPSTKEVARRPRRSEHQLHPGMHPMELLQIWSDIQELDVPILTSEHLKPALELADETLGQLERLVSLEVVGCGKFSEPARIDFSDRSAIFGACGSGKSLLLESVYAVLYGHWPQKGRNHLADLADPNVVAKIALTFRAREQTWKVQREFHKGSQKNVRLECIDDPETVFKGPDAVRDYARELVGPPDLFLATVLMTQQGTGDLVDAGPAERMDLIRQLLGCNRFEPIHAAADKNVRRLEDELYIQQMACKDLEETRERETRVLGQLNQTENKLIASVAVRDAKHFEMADFPVVREDPIALREKIQHFQCQVTFIERKLKACDEKVEQARDDETYQVAVGQRDRLRAEMDSLQIVNAKASHLVELKRLAEPLERAGCARQGFLPCPFIDMSVCARKQAQEVSEELVVLTEKLPPPRDGFSFDVHFERVKQTLRLLEETISTVAKLRARRPELEEERRQFVEQWKSVNVLIVEQQKLLESVLDEERTDLQDEFELYEQDVVKLTTEKARLEGELAWLTAQIESQTVAAEKAREIENDKAGWDFLKRAFGRTGVPQLLIDNALPSIQEAVDRLTQTYFENRFELVLSTQEQLKDGRQKEAFSIRFLQNGREYDAISCSGGEKTAVRGVLRKAIAEWILGGGQNHVSLQDEPTAAQDGDWKTMTMAMFRDETQHTGQVVVVTHDSDMVLEFSDRVFLDYDGWETTIA